MKAIGIDIGTTSISAVVLENDKKSIREIRTIPNDSFIKTEHEWERIQNVERIIAKSTKLLDELLEQYSDVSAIGLTGQMHGILYLDMAGKCISPLYTWQDQRGDLPEFDGQPLTTWIKEMCGDTAASGYGLVTHTYLYKKNLLPRQAASLCTISDYLGMILTGRNRPLLHISMAASLGLFDIRKHTFFWEKIEKLGVNTGILPDVTTHFSVLGTYKGRPVSVAIGDNQASFLGAVGLEEDTVLLNVGTGSQISVLSNRFFECNGIEARPLTEDTFLLAGSSLCGGRAYAILEKFFRKYMTAAGADECEQYGIMTKLAEAAESRRKTREAGISNNDGNILHDSINVTTTFRGTRTNPALRGSITNLSEDNFTPEELVHGVLRGIAQELYDMYDRIHKGTGMEMRRLVASGNGVRKNAVLVRIFEEMFGENLQLTAQAEEAACGAALCSMFK